MFDARSIWMAMAAFVLVFAGWRAMAPSSGPALDPTSEPTAIVSQGYGPQLTYARITRAECVGNGERLWLAHNNGFDCVRVFAPPTTTANLKAQTAIVFFDGDVPAEDQSSAGEVRMKSGYERLTQVLSDRYKSPVFVVARPGILGSSGAHYAGGQRDEGHVIYAALDELKRQHGTQSFVLAGQSGGARVIAQLLVLGRRDITCAVMGSGAYDLPRLKSGERTATNIFGDPARRFLIPMRQLNDIASQSSRRLFIAGDPRDTVTPFQEQRAWAESLNRLGHHAVLVEGEANGKEFHGMTEKSLAAAGACAQGKPDAEVVAAVGKRVVLGQ
jgi:pimeloyl-ACP methyl ester carboxylesterase